MKKMLLILLATASPLGAQTITLKNGSTVQGENLKRSGDNIVAAMRVGTGKASVGYAISSIAKIDFPQPPDLGRAQDLLLDGNAGPALAAIEPVVAAQAPFRQISGNWWERAAGIKLMALCALRRDAEAGPLAAELLAASAGQPARRIAELAQALALSRKGDFQRALKSIAPILKESHDADTLAFAWICVGESQSGLKESLLALRAYLHLPIFYPDQKLWMPAALLGSARAFEALDDLVRARESLDELLAAYGASPEAALAKADLKRLDIKLKTQRAASAN